MNRLTASERADGWELLFDGDTTDEWRGFRQDSMPDGWKVVDGALTRVAPAGDIITKKQFKNFELQLEWKIAEAGNSGIMFRVTEDQRRAWLSGPEMQVLDDARHRDGQVPETSAGSNYGLHAPKPGAVRAAGSWNSVRLLVRESHVEHWLNGVKVVEYELESPEWERLVSQTKFDTIPSYGRQRTGHIALQDHGDRVAYRNIKIKRLP
ncbi:MAG: DUF1080 domain-containing protein [Gemmatimonadetes bacterium]|nr:DUF1080 domain-containing protein [Gemmatimonadota bacterium]MCH7715355.1 DUF1080 domain-containing protein [Gemmatimonadota bacterium]